MTEEYRPDLIEETPHPESLRRLCWENVLEYMYLVLIFFKDRWLSKAPDCKSFNEALVILVMH
jgi:hypothetical protein